MRDPVDLAVAVRIGVAKVGGEIHHRKLAGDRRGGFEERRHLGRRGLVRGCRKCGEAGIFTGGAAEQLPEIARGGECFVRKDRGQVGE